MQSLWEYVVCVGDSLTFGARDEYGRGYPAELSDVLNERTGRVWICFNEGVNGETSSDVLRRFPRLVKSYTDVNVITLMVGTNDTKIPIPGNVYRSNMKQMIEIGHVLGRHVILGLIPELRTNPWYSQRHSTYRDKYNEIARDLAESHQLRVADFTDMTSMLVDGIHLGNEGYKEMAGRWADQILQI